MGFRNPDFTLLDHTADLGIIVRGTSLKDLFEAAAQSLMQIMVKRAGTGTPITTKRSISGQDLADLMVRWLGEILYMLYGEKRVITQCAIEAIVPTHLDAVLEWVPFDPDLHVLRNEVKAVTYHQIEVAEKGKNWEARIIFDL